ncbi:MAG: sigma-70 family RNA polymerase sigma factor [Anaerolineae bacterium]|nr:sigma-70 family RNA polymerase sigma factor [Anaerolineae bacterium]
MVFKTPAEALAALHRMARGDPTALGDLYDRYGRLVYSLAYRVLGDTSQAEEVTQDTFLKVWREPLAWDPAHGRFDGWLLTLARYTAIDRLRMETRRAPGGQIALEDDVASDDDGPDGLNGLDSLDLAHLHGLLEALPPAQRQVVELAFFNGLTHSELAEALHLPLGTVKTRLRLALQKLKSWWESQFGPPD